jgi:hypothetical protein
MVLIASGKRRRTNAYALQEEKEKTNEKETWQEIILDIFAPSVYNMCSRLEFTYAS